MVNFVIRIDTKKIFRFAPLQSPAGQALLNEYGLPKEKFDSFVLIEEGKTFSSSTAALRVVKYFPWYLKPALIFWLIPKQIRDGAYDTIARNRYKWIGKKEACMLPSEEIKGRFL